MSRIPALLTGTLVLCACALAFTCEAQRRRAKQEIVKPLEAETVPFCELVSHPEKYDNRVVRTEAISTVGLESQALYDPQCSTVETRTWVTYDNADWSRADRKLTAAYYNLLEDPNNGRHPRTQSGRARAVLVGRFESSSKDGYGHLGKYRFQFIIKGIEKVEKVAEDVPYWP